MNCLWWVVTERWLAFCRVKVKWALSHGSERESGGVMEWVDGQYQQCAYGGKMLGGN